MRWIPLLTVQLHLESVSPPCGVPLGRGTTAGVADRAGTLIPSRLPSYPPPLLHPPLLSSSAPPRHPGEAGDVLDRGTSQHPRPRSSASGNSLPGAPHAKRKDDSGRRSTAPEQLRSGQGAKAKADAPFPIGSDPKTKPFWKNKKGIKGQGL